MFITAMDWRGAEMSHENNSTGRTPLFSIRIQQSE